jgi:hypothetical protein
MRSVLWLALVLSTKSALAFTSESPIDLPNGCTIFLQQFRGPTTLYRTEGACKNGLAEGTWTYGLEPIPDFKVFRMCGQKGGKSSGVTFSVTQTTARVNVSEPEFNGVHFEDKFQRSGTTDQFATFLSAIDRANAIANKKGLNTIDASKAKAILRKWKQGDDAIFDQWVTGPGTTPPWHNGMSKSARFPQAYELSSQSADDPKVFGRSAVSNEEELRKTEELRQANEQREANLRRNQENQARIAREKEEREARELKELTDTLQQLSNSLGNLRRR